MDSHSRLRCVIRWVGTALCILILVAFLFSTRRAAIWKSASLRHDINLMLGTIGYAWRPEGWRAEDEHYPGTPGWTVAGYGTSPRLCWWVAIGASKASRWVCIPLWIPLLLVAMPTALLWYRDRRTVPAAIRRLTVWLTPERPKKVTFWLVAAFCVIHVAALFVAFWVFQHVYPFFVDYRPGDPVSKTVEAALPILFWATPLWGIVWAWAYTRWANRLFSRQPGRHCAACGYDLTGNVSGRCPECGDPI